MFSRRVDSRKAALACRSAGTSPRPALTALSGRFVLHQLSADAHLALTRQPAEKREGNLLASRAGDTRDADHLTRLYVEVDSLQHARPQAANLEHRLPVGLRSRLRHVELLELAPDHQRDERILVQPLAPAG